MADVGIGTISAPVVGVAQETEGADSVVHIRRRSIETKYREPLLTQGWVNLWDPQILGGISLKKGEDRGKYVTLQL